MKKATFVRDISENFTGEARLYAVEDRTGRDAVRRYR
jgi:hypothetical protein